MTIFRCDHWSLRYL